jgi:hypothetical protein
MTTSHDFSQAESAWLVGVYDERERLIWALPIISRPLAKGPLHLPAVEEEGVSW